jgi:ABC-2 type transport system ATP-binding protein
MAIIEVENLVRTRGEVQAIAGVSFLVERGEIYGLLGPNGAGKTSTIEVLEGLDSFDAGAVTVLGKDISAEPQAIKERIGVQLQTTGLPRYLNPRETLELFASFYSSPSLQYPVGLLKRVGLEHVGRRLNSKLSGGERQRLALALALINDPEVLFLDEPSAGLDPSGRRDLWAIIREWQAGGRTVFLTTHDMAEAERLCHRVAIMDHGRIVAEGSVTSLLASETVEQAIWIEQDGQPVRDDLEEVLTGVSRMVAAKNGVLIYTADAMRTIGDLIALRSRGEVDFSSFQLRTASLEDVFLRRTGRRLEE